MLRSAVRSWLTLLCLGLLVAGCAETQLVATGVKELRRLEPPSGAEAGSYKLGKPYQVRGIWYYPKVDYAYDETGIASWYGPRFDGKETANGEVFDEGALTAAHKTLPLPSMVRVTNLDNGRSLKLRVNDRGPFAPGRIIDVSRRAARLLGFEKRGTAKVRVRIIESDSRRLAAAAMGRTPPKDTPPAVPTVAVASADVSARRAPPSSADGEGTVSSAAVTATALPRPDGEVTYTAVRPSDIFIQAGSFLHYDNANRLRARLSPLGRAQITPAEVRDQRFFRVRLGPVTDVAEADRLLQVLIDNGYTDARVVVD